MIRQIKAKKSGNRRKTLTVEERERITHRDIPPSGSAYNSKSTSKLVGARNTALLLVEKQERLVEILRTSNAATGTLSEERQVEAKGLMKRIQNYKSALEQSGNDPEEAVKWAIAARQEFFLRKTDKAGPKTTNGIGMYNLGNTLKNWR